MNRVAAATRDPVTERAAATGTLVSRNVRALPHGALTRVRAPLLALGLTVLLAVSPGAASSQVTSGTSTTAGASASSLSFSHTVASGSGRLLVVGVAIKDEIPVTAVTYGGVALTRRDTAQSTGSAVRAELWYLIAPTVGTATVAVTMSSSADFVAGATGYYGVDQSTPIRGSARAAGTGNPTITIASQGNDLVVDVAADKAVSSASVGGGQTSTWTRSNGSGGGNAWGGSSAEAGAASVTMTWTTSGSGAGEWASVAVSLIPSPTTTLGTGTDPASASLAPGGAATMADAFTLQTSSGTDAITAATVTLASGTSGGLSLVEVTNDAGTTVYGSVTNPASDTPAITLTTNITATTTSTQYKIRVTPKSHANMPAPAGSTYGLTARISGWTGSNTQAGSDAAGTTVTIDNLSPGNVSGSTAAAGVRQVVLSWTNPGDTDLGSIVVLRRATTAVADVPTEGATYSAGNTVGTSTVACVLTAPTSGCTDTGLTAGTAYHYKVFTKDASGNYASGAVPTGSPATPTAPSMTLAESVSPSGTQVPGTELTFTGLFTNGGTAAAHSVVITNPVPSNTDFKVGSATQNLGTTGLSVVVVYSSDGGSTWTYTPVSGAGGAPAGFDRLVTHVRWTFTGNLSQTAPGNAGSVSATMRIR